MAGATSTASPARHASGRHACAGPGAPPVDGYGTGTFVVLDAVSSPLDDTSFTAIAQAAAEHRLDCQEVGAGTPPAHPLDNDRALRAWYLPQEGFLDARVWLATLDAALESLPHVIRVPAGALTEATGGGNLLTTRASTLRTPRAVVAAGAFTRAGITARTGQQVVRLPAAGRRPRGDMHDGRPLQRGPGGCRIRVRKRRRRAPYRSTCVPG
ncbi:hypothetical protein ACIRF8_09200 [Streptomyces sp. NPDC102406]|uniref:hypothetical protein n=1 Tax=Streptomyces sp. NPDC102406 TaxID=3366171 RepID=UPI00380867A7